MRLAPRLTPPLRTGVLTVAASVCIASAMVGSSSATDSERGDRATGTATNQYPTPAGPGMARLSVRASNGASGAFPYGYVQAAGTTGAPMGAFAVAGPVTCLRVVGNKAAIKYSFSRASGIAAPFKGGGIEVFVEDNGGARSGPHRDANAFDQPQPAGVFQATAAVCDDPTTAPYDTVSSGHYEVRSATVDN